MAGGSLEGEKSCLEGLVVLKEASGLVMGARRGPNSEQVHSRPGGPSESHWVRPGDFDFFRGSWSGQNSYLGFIPRGLVRGILGSEQYP